MKNGLAFSRVVSLWLVASLLVGPAFAAQASPAAQAGGQFDLHGPAGSGAFGTQVVALPNGNIVVTDPYYSANGQATVGAVYLYNGRTHALISTLTGSTAGDAVGNTRVTVLSNGNYVVLSPFWNNGGATRAGAATWCSGVTGCSGVVSAANSLVGQTAGEPAYDQTVIALPNGNYVVLDPNWTNGAVTKAGAATWCRGVTGCVGVVTADNSLVGSTAGDQVGIGLKVLPNGNYVVLSPDWSNGPATQAGAVTLINEATGITGTVSVTNSLVGGTTGDQVGYYDIVVLSNGNYVVLSPFWNNGGATKAGAVTWVNAAAGITGAVTVANSLVGSNAGDQVGDYHSVTPLTNGNYVVQDYGWDNGTATNVGAVTWGNGSTGITGTVSATNSLVGSASSGHVGGSVTALSNGNYVVDSSWWSDGAEPGLGAVTWGNGATGLTGTVSAANSLVGSLAYNQVGECDSNYCESAITALSNGNYVVDSSWWDNDTEYNVGAVTWGNGATGITGTVSAANSLVGTFGDEQVGLRGVTPLSNGNYVVDSPYGGPGGAVTWGNGATGVTGTVSAANSLVGSRREDFVGSDGVTALTNGNYVVSSRSWDNGAVQSVGAVTWGDGTQGITGVVSTTNSLVGSKSGDAVGLYGAVALSNGNYVVCSLNWSNRAAAKAGAVTWGNGALGTIGVVSTTNSLVGISAGDQVCYSGIILLSNGNYVVRSPLYANGALGSAGAVTLGYSSGGPTGLVSSLNSVVGGVADGGPVFGYGFPFVYDDANSQLVVGRPAENIVTFFAALGLRVLSNGLIISPGSAQPSSANGTDFGVVTAGQALTHTFTLSNTRPSDVTLSGDPLVQISGPGAADFAVVALPTTPVLANTATTFQVRFTPSVAGTRVVTVTILSEDASPYTFALQGTGVTTAAYLPLVRR